MLGAEQKRRKFPETSRPDLQFDPAKGSEVLRQPLRPLRLTSLRRGGKTIYHMAWRTNYLPPFCGRILMAVSFPLLSAIFTTWPETAFLDKTN